MSDNDGDGCRYLKDNKNIKVFHSHSKDQIKIDGRLISALNAEMHSDLTIKWASKPMLSTAHIELKHIANAAAVLAAASVISAGEKVEASDAQRRTVIERPPGHRLIMLLGSVLTKRSFERTFGQTIADAREEYYAASADGDESEAKKLKRDLNLTILKICWQSMMELPSDMMTSLFGKVFGKGD